MSTCRNFRLRRFSGEEEKVFGELHGQGGKALAIAAGAHVGEQRAKHAGIVDAIVLEEVAILDGGDGGHQVFGQLVIGNEAALGMALVGEAGDEERLQLISRELLSVVAGDLTDGAAGKVNGGAILRVVRRRAWMDGHSVVTWDIGAHGGGFALAIDGVASLLQLLLDLGGLDFLARADFRWRGVDAGGLREEGMLQPVVHHVAHFGPVIGEDHAAQNGDHRTAQACGDEDIASGDADSEPRHFNFDDQLGFTPSLLFQTN